MNELRFANWLCVVMPRVVEAVNTHFHRAIALHVIHLQRAWDEFPGLAHRAFFYLDWNHNLLPITHAASITMYSAESPAPRTKICVIQDLFLKYAVCP
jgi:hypothetical protein